MATKKMGDWRIVERRSRDFLEIRRAHSVCADRVIVRRLLGHNRHENLGTYAAKGSTRAALSRYGAGIFDVWGMNRAGKYLCMKRHRVSVTRFDLHGDEALRLRSWAQGDTTADALVDKLFSMRKEEVR